MTQTEVPIEERTYVEHRRTYTDMTEMLDQTGRLKLDVKERGKFKGWTDGVLGEYSNPLSVKAIDRVEYHMFYWRGRHYRERTLSHHSQIATYAVNLLSKIRSNP